MNCFSIIPSLLFTASTLLNQKSSQTYDHRTEQTIQKVKDKNMKHIYLLMYIFTKVVPKNFIQGKYKVISYDI